MVRLSTSPEGQAQLTQKYFTTLDKYGVACFVKDPASMLMWSYYADGHRGIAVRFDTGTFLQKFQHACIPLEVKYGRDFPEDLSFYSEDRFGLVQNTLGTKAEAWKHEEEWRLVLVGKSGYLQMPPGMIDGIVLGLRTPSEVERSVRSWLDGRADHHRHDPAVPRRDRPRLLREFTEQRHSLAQIRRPRCWRLYRTGSAR